MIAKAQQKMWAKSGNREFPEGTLETAVHLQICRVGNTVSIRQITGNFFKLAVLCACVSRVSVYDLEANSNGYTVRASATLTRGTPVKIVCLTNYQGGIRDVTVDER